MIWGPGQARIWVGPKIREKPAGPDPDDPRIDPCSALVTLTCLYLISVVFKIQDLLQTRRLKTGVEPTMLPIVMLFTLCLFYCVYSDMKDDIPT